MRDIEFVCPECGQNILCAIQRVIETVSMDSVEEEYEALVPGDVLETHNIEIDEYACAMCGFTVGWAEEATIGWLIEHDMLGEEY